MSIPRLTIGCPHWSRERVAEALESNDTKREAAEELGVTPRTLRRWEKKHGLWEDE